MEHLFNSLIKLDTDILLALNGMHSPMFDKIMWLVTGKWIWIGFYIALAAFMLYRIGWRRGILALVMIGLIITLSDQICSHLIRPIFERLRPANENNPISLLVHIVNDYRGGSYGFPSCHAANTFALATFLSRIIKIRIFAIAIFIWAAIVSYSRIYLGVHYSGDIVVGAAIGALCAYTFHYIYIKLIELHTRAKEKNESFISVVISAMGIFNQKP